MNHNQQQRPTVFTFLIFDKFTLQQSESGSDVTHLAIVVMTYFSVGNDHLRSKYVAIGEHQRRKSK